MRRRLLALVLSLAALTALAPVAGAEQVVEHDTDYVCVRSRMLLGDPVCIKWNPGS